MDVVFGKAVECEMLHDDDDNDDDVERTEQQELKLCLQGILCIIFGMFKHRFAWWRSEFYERLLSFSLFNYRKIRAEFFLLLTLQIIFAYNESIIFPSPSPLSISSSLLQSFPFQNRLFICVTLRWIIHKINIVPS